MTGQRLSCGIPAHPDCQRPTPVGTGRRNFITAFFVLSNSGGETGFRFRWNCPKRCNKAGGTVGLAGLETY